MNLFVHMNYSDPRRGGDFFVAEYSSLEDAVESVTKWLYYYEGHGEIRQSGKTVREFDNAGVREPLRSRFPARRPYCRA